jgi:hypothetical protein
METLNLTIQFKEVTHGESSKDYCSLFSVFGIQFISNLTSGRAHASQQIEHMLPQINYPAASIYRRAVCRIAIAFMCRLYPIEVYSHKGLADLAQECLDLIEETKPQCGPVYYARYFDRLQKFATILRRWHANKASLQTLAEEEKIADEDVLEMDVMDVTDVMDVMDVMEETIEALRNHPI